jgi:hypothetical protein
VLARDAERLARRGDRRLAADVGRASVVENQEPSVLARELPRQPRLADAGRAGERDEPGALDEEAAELRELALAPEERRGGARQRRRRWAAYFVSSPSAITPMKISPTISIAVITF